jgi:hypothetical protein
MDNYPFGGGVVASRWTGPGLFLLAFATLGCATDTPSAAVTSGSGVVTYHDTAVNFGSFGTYAIVTQVAIVEGTRDAPVFTFEPAPEILGAVESNMAARGYVLVARIDPAHPPVVPPSADLAITVFAHRQTDFVFVTCGYWPWWGLPQSGCSQPWAWVPFTTGTLLVDMSDLRDAPNPIVAGDIARVWAGVGFSVLTQSTSSNTALAVSAVNQAFAQSPYLRTP